MWVFLDDKNHNTFSNETYSPPPTYQPSNFPVYSSSTFMGYRCIADCSGHEAGYEWAEENNIDDPDDCGGNSDSFIEGCKAYADDQQAAMRETSDDE